MYRYVISALPSHSVVRLFCEEVRHHAVHIRRDAHRIPPTVSFLHNSVFRAGTVPPLMMDAMCNWGPAALCRYRLDMVEYSLLKAILFCHSCRFQSFSYFSLYRVELYRKPTGGGRAEQLCQDPVCLLSHSAGRSSRSFSLLCPRVTHSALLSNRPETSRLQRHDQSLMTATRRLQAYNVKRYWVQEDCHELMDVLMQ